MKKILFSLFLLCLLSLDLIAQDRSVRPQAIGVSFVLNDFTTAQRIRSGSLEKVLREKKWAKFADMAPGLGLTYFKGLNKHVDFAGTLTASFVNYPFPKRPPTPSDGLLLEGDASVNLKMFSDDYWFTPYLSLGVGASKYSFYYGAFIPLGGGFKVNLFDEASLFITTQYRVPVTTENANYHFSYSIGVSGVIGKKKALK
jgi:OOP family OmpA-OmpF porin